MILKSLKKEARKDRFSSRPELKVTQLLFQLTPLSPASELFPGRGLHPPGGACSVRRGARGATGCSGSKEEMGVRRANSF